MKTSERKELVQYPIEKLVEKLHEFQQELFRLRLNSSTAHIKDYSQFRKAKKNIARVLTLLHQKFSDKNKV
jgi:large subunit ribosomal protein L29